MTTTTEAYRNALALGKAEQDFAVLTGALLTAMASGRYDPIDVNYAQLEDKFVTNEDKISNWIGASDDRYIETEGKQTLKLNFSTEAFLQFLAWAWGAPTSGAASSNAIEVQKFTITGTLTAGGWDFSFRGATTPELPYNMTDTAFQAALEALPTIGAGNVAVALASGVYTITFAGTLVNQPLPLIVARVRTTLVGGTAAMSTFTEGSAAGDYQHTFHEPSVCTLTPPSFPYAEAQDCGASPETRVAYPGSATAQIKIEINDKGFISLTVDLMLSGEEIPIASFTFPVNESAVTELLGNMVTAYFGTSYSDVINADELASVAITFDIGVEAVPSINNLTRVSAWRYAKGKPTGTIELTVKGDKASRFYTLWRNGRFGTRPKFKLVIDPTGTAGVTKRRDVTISADKCYMTATLDKDGKEPRLKITLNPRGNSTDVGKFTVVGYSSLAAYNVAA